MSRNCLLCLVGLAALTACAAQAEPLTLAPYNAGAVAVAALPVKSMAAPAPAPDLANPLDALAPTTLQAKTMDSVVFARTAVDHRLASDVTGSLGFLCGLQPGHGDSGGAAAFGTDPHGRFVGAKISFAF